MNILFLASWYPTVSKPGLGIFIKEHAIAVSKVGCNVFVIAILYTNSKKILQIDYNYHVEEYGIKVYTIEVRGMFAKPLNYFFPFNLFITKKIMKKIIKQDKVIFDLIHSNVVFPAAITGYFISRHLKLPHVITEHWSRVNSILNLPVLGHYVRLSYMQSQKIMPVSNFLKNTLEHLIPELDKSKFQIVANVIDPDIFYYNEKKSDITKPIFCAIATWVKKKIPDKLPELFIESLSEFQNLYGIKPRIIIVGGGNLVDDLKILCEEKKLDAVFTGALNKNEIVSVLHSVDYFIHATTIETFGVVVAEALITGTPVICSNKGALPELVNMSNGILCDNTVSDWVEKLNQLFTLSFDNQKISTDIREKFSSKNIGHKIFTVYNEVLSLNNHSN